MLAVCQICQYFPCQNFALYGICTYEIAVYVALLVFMSIKQLRLIIMQDLPPVQPIDFVLSEESMLEEIGSVHSIVEQIGRCVYGCTVANNIPLVLQILGTYIYFTFLTIIILRKINLFINT